MTVLDRFPPMPCPVHPDRDRWSCGVCGARLIAWDRAEAQADNVARDIAYRARSIARSHNAVEAR